MLKPNKLLDINNMARWVWRKAFNLFHALSPISRRKAAQWEKTDGVDYLRRIGVKEGDCVIDFGCGPGNFCIPAAQLVGADGRVYAVDKNPQILKKVGRKAGAIGLQNLRAAGSLTELMPWPGDRRCNVALLYDMLHFLDASERRELYAVLHGVLAENGLLSVHPKHVQDDAPRKYFMTMTVADVIREIEAAGFILVHRLSLQVWHDHGQYSGIICNFKKRARSPLINNG